MKISVVIPVRNEETSLPTLAESLLQQTHRPDEVIIVNGGSTDGTLALARELEAGSESFRVLDVGEATPGKGRNLGAAAARNQWIAFTDAGTRLESSWLANLATIAESEPDVEVVYGNYEPITDSLFERCAKLAYTSPKQLRPGGLMRGPSTASMMLDRRVWEKLGGFPDLRASEDLAFMKKVEDGGFKVCWAPQATVWWQLQPDLAHTFLKFVLYSKHNVMAGRQHEWHYGIMRQYIVLLALVGLAILHSKWWVVAIVAGFAARVFLSVWRRREGRGLLWALNPVQLAGVGIILLTIDLATFVGWAQALWSRNGNGRKKQPATR